MNKARQKDKNQIDFKILSETSKNRTWFASVASDQATRPNNLSQSEFSKEKETKDRQQNRSVKYENDILKLEREKKVKMVLNELGISTVKEIPENFQSLDDQNMLLLQKN